MDALLRLAARIDALTTRVGRAVSWLVVAMVAVGAWNALARYSERWTGLRLTSNALNELQWYLFSVVFLFGAPWALRAGAHVRVDVLYASLPRRDRVWIDLVGAVLLLVPFCLFAVVAALPSTLDSIERLEGSPDPGGLARWPLRIALPLAFALLAVQGVSEAIHAVARLRGRRARDDDGAPGPGRPEGT